MSEEKNCIRHEMTNLTLFRGHCPSYKTDKLWHRYVISVTASLETSGIRAVERVINKSSSPRKFFTPDLALIRRPRWTYAEINGRSRAIGRVFFFFFFFFFKLLIRGKPRVEGFTPCGIWLALSFDICSEVPLFDWRSRRSRRLLPVRLFVYIMCG